MARKAAKGTWGGRRPGAGRPPEVLDPVRVTVDLERPDAEALRVLVDQTGRSLSALVREAVGRYVARERRKEKR